MTQVEVYYAEISLDKFSTTDDVVFSISEYIEENYSRKFTLESIGINEYRAVVRNREGSEVFIFKVSETDY